MISVAVPVGRVLTSLLLSSGKLWNISSAVFAVIKNFKSTAATQLFEKIKSSIKKYELNGEWWIVGFVSHPLIKRCGQAAEADRSGSKPVKVKCCPFHCKRTFYFENWVQCYMPQARSVLSRFFFSFSKFSVIQQWSLNNRVGTICSALMCKNCDSSSICWISIQIADTLSCGFFPILKAQF